MNNKSVNGILDMGRKLLCAILFLSLFSCGSIYDYPEDIILKDNNWRIVWEDNFNNSTIDMRYWSKVKRYSNTVRWNRYMSDNDSCYDVKDGVFILRGLINDFSSDTARFLTGGITTEKKKTIAYGKIEIRAKINKVEGAWPAIWMKSDERAWPIGGEIDIMENYGFHNAIHQTIHSYYTLNINTNTLNYTVNDVKDKSEYNIYGVIINKDEVIFHVNNHVTFVYKKMYPEVEHQFPFGDEKFLILSMQLDSHGYNSTYISNVIPEMHVDWVRFYEKIDESIPDY